MLNCAFFGTCTCFYSRCLDTIPLKHGARCNGTSLKHIGLISIFMSTVGKPNKFVLLVKVFDPIYSRIGIVPGCIGVEDR